MQRHGVRELSVRGGGITIFGRNLGPVRDDSKIIPYIVGSGMFQYDDASSNTEVLMNGTALPITYCVNGQINAMIPYSATPGSKVQVAVRRFGVVSNTFMLDVEDASPGVLSVNQTGDGQAVVLKENGQVNGDLSGDLWLVPGEKIRIFTTGLGKIVPAPSIEGLIAYRNQNPTTTVLPVSVTIGGRPAEVTYVGPMEGYVNSVVVVEAIAPTGLTGGRQPLRVKAGSKENTIQHVTVLIAER